MKATHTFTLRVPLGWQSLGSANVRPMLATYLQRPTPDLPADPGPGDARLSLSLPSRAVKVVSALLNENESAALRRVIAASRGLPFTVQARSLPIERPHARVIEAEVIRPRALLPANSVVSDGTQKIEAASLRESLGRSMNVTPEYRAKVEARIAELEGKQSEAVQPEPVQARSEMISLWRIPAMRLLLLLALLFCGFVFFYGRAHKTSEPAKPKPGPRFRPWSPAS